jgi:hypothetical protein
MARKIRLTPYDEQILDEYDEGADGAEYMAYGSAPSMATEDEYLTEDPMPLFLSSHDEEEYQPRGFGSGGDGNRPVLPRILKAGIFVASAAAIAFAAISVENPLSLFANAKASLIGSSADQSAATPSAQPVSAVQLASNNRPMPVVAQAADRNTAPSVRVMPTRDDIALALKAAHQNQAEGVQPSIVPPQPVAAPARLIDPDELATLLKRARSLIEIGDIAPARLLLERAADAQEPSAALLLAQTYDPAVLGTQDMRSITPDPAMARDWYQKAARFGSPDAQQRLAQMQN